MTTNRSLVSDGILLTGLQGLASVGQLVGIRLLTEILSPEVFGEFSLWLGFVALVSSGIANPTMQAMLRYYPEYALEGKGWGVRKAVRCQLAKLFLWAIPVIIAGILAALIYGRVTVWILVLFFALMAVDIVRMQNTAILNAISAHRSYGLWAVADAWGRPILAWVLVYFFSADTTLILAGYFVASLCTSIVMLRFVPQENDLLVSSTEQLMILDRFWKYSLPLLPLGIIGWIAGMADRYMIGAFLSTADVGLYVSIYGLASRPMLMFSGIIETTIRPAYHSALIEGDQLLARKFLSRWTLFVLLGSLVALGFAWVGHPFLAYVFLGEQFRKASYLLPWIVGGYALLTLSHVANRVCYANEATRSVLFIEVIGAFSAVIFGFVGIKWDGLEGAAVSVSLYYGLQCVISYILARRWLKNGRQTIPRWKLNI